MLKFIWVDWLLIPLGNFPREILLSSTLAHTDNAGYKGAHGIWFSRDQIHLLSHSFCSDETAGQGSLSKPCYQWWGINDQCTKTLILLFSRLVVSDSLRPPWTATRQASLSSTSSQRLLKFMSIELVMIFNHFILCYPFLLLPSIFSSIRIFSNELTLNVLS